MISSGLPFYIGVNDQTGNVGRRWHITLLHNATQLHCWHKIDFFFQNVVYVILFSFTPYHNQNSVTCRLWKFNFKLPCSLNCTGKSGKRPFLKWLHNPHLLHYSKISYIIAFISLLSENANLMIIVFDWQISVWKLHLTVNPVLTRCN